jgi:hypothetical protein
MLPDYSPAKDNSPNDFLLIRYLRSLEMSLFELVHFRKNGPGHVERQKLQSICCNQQDRLH